MQLTQFTDYSLRVLIYLARLPKPGLATIPEIAGYHRISRNHLVKVVNNLTNEGFVISTRGKGGGIRLARPHNAIGIGEVVRLTEPHMRMVECFEPKTCECRLSRNCRLKDAFYEARKAFMAVLDGYTLADVSGDDSEFMALFAGGADPLSPQCKEEASSL